MKQNNARYRQLSLFLLLPLVLLAVSSYATGPVSARTFADLEGNLPMFLCGFLQPGLFALIVALFIPARSRFLQLLTVFSCYLALGLINLRYLPDVFCSPTAPLLASLAATIVFIPPAQEDRYRGPVRQSALIVLARPLCAAVSAGVTFVLMVVLARQIDFFVTHIFTADFINSQQSFIVVPAYLIQQTLGFNQEIGLIPDLNLAHPNIQALLNAILLTDLLSLPAIILTRGFLTRSWPRFFLIMLGLVTLLTSHIGACISIELAVILMFFPGTYFIILISSCLLFFVCLHIGLMPLTRFSMLWQPDLQLLQGNILRFTEREFSAIMAAVILPAVLIVISSMLRRRRRRKIMSRIRMSSAGFQATQKSSPDICVLAILSAVGGLGNLRSVNRQGSMLFLHVRDTKKVYTGFLYQICRGKPVYEPHGRFYVCDLGENSFTIAERLHRIIVSDQNITDSADVTLSQPFVIRDLNKETAT